MGRRKHNKTLTQGGTGQVHHAAIFIIYCYVCIPAWLTFMGADPLMLLLPPKMASGLM